MIGTAQRAPARARIMRKREASNDDIRREVIRQARDVARLTSWEASIPRKDIPFVLWKYLRDHVPYFEQGYVQSIRRPRALVEDELTADCKSTAVFAAGLAAAAGCDAVVRFAQYPGKDWFSHVYAIVDGKVCDPLLDFDREDPYVCAEDHTVAMELEVIGAGPYQDPRDPMATQTPVPGGVVENRPPAPAANDQQWMDRAVSYYNTGAKLYEAGAATGLQLNPSELVSAAASGAAAGAPLGGVGAPVGAVIAVAITIVGKLFGGNRPSIWDNAGSGVHWWFTNYGRQAYLDWIISTGNTGVFRSVQDSAKGYIVWLLTYERNLLMPPPAAAYSGRMDWDYIYDATGLTDYQAKWDWISALYADFGIDYAATVDLWTANGRSSTIMMKNRVFIGDGEDDGDSGTDSGSGSGLVLFSGLALAAIVANAVSKGKRRTIGRTKTRSGSRKRTGRKSSKKR